MSQALRWFLLLLFSYIHLNVHAKEEVQDLDKVVEEVAVKKSMNCWEAKHPLLSLSTSRQKVMIHQHLVMVWPTTGNEKRIRY